MLLSEAKKILKDNGYMIQEANSSFGIVNNKQLRKLLDNAGYEDVYLYKGRGFFYIFAEGEEHSNWLNALDSMAIYLNAFKQQSVEEWFDDIDNKLRKGHRLFTEYHSEEPIDEDFGVGVASCGADQGIPHDGDCKAVVPTRFGKLQRRDLPMRMKKRKKRK